MAWLVVAACTGSPTRASWLAPSTTRYALSVESAASCCCFRGQSASLPTPALSTTSGLSPKSRREAASCIESLARPNSSMVLRRVPGVAVLTRTSSRSRVRAGARDQALAWVDELTPFAATANRSWALADIHLGRALTAADLAEAVESFEGALRHVALASRPFDLARVRLAYGEFLRRANRRVEARGHLRSALATFTDLGASPLMARTTQELRASGETARTRDPSTLLDLTPMERTVAQMVSTGLSNKDVAAQCWVSPRTVAFHLRNVFAKVGVSSRTELAHLDLG